MSVPLDAVERELARLWVAAGRDDAHAVALDLVAFCATPDELPRVRACLASVAATHPMRTLTVACHPGPRPSIEARVALHVNPARGDEPCGEDVELEVRGEARDWVPSTLVGLRVPDLPVCVWWVGDLPDEDTLYDRLVETADVALVHSADMDLRDLQKLSDLVEWARYAYALNDLNWTRLGSWQELLARFFDDPAALRLLGSLDALTVRFNPRPHTREPVSTQAALFAGWLLGRLGWAPGGPLTWRTDGPEPVATLGLPGGRALSVRFVKDAREGVSPGALTRVCIQGEGVAFTVARAEEDPLVLCWTGEAPGVLVPSQCVRVRAPDEPRILARVLEHPARDALFERSLAVAAALVGPVAPPPGEH